jgi:2-oxoglutarate ferredoxin oxidoreductase subunit beta
VKGNKLMEKLADMEEITGKPGLWREKSMSLPFSPGCQYPLVVWAILEAVEELGIEGQVIFLGGTGDAIEVPAMIDIDAMQCPHGRAPDIASTMKRVLGKDAVVVTCQDDDDCIAAGTETLLHSAARGEKITVVMANSGSYVSSGWQLAPPGGKKIAPPVHQPPAAMPYNVIDILCGMKGVVYAARGAVIGRDSYLQVKGYIKTALQKQMGGEGFGFVEVMTAYPSHWGLTYQESIRWIKDKLIPQYPLGEFKNVAKIER